MSSLHYIKVAAPHDQCSAQCHRVNTTTYATYYYNFISSTLCNSTWYILCFHNIIKFVVCVYTKFRLIFVDVLEGDLINLQGSVLPFLAALTSQRQLTQALSGYRVTVVILPLLMGCHTYLLCSTVC